ncbi:MAG: hypothetical protein H7066_11520 [Cytophagaceae bacterium]|nr:hypothetical protein [Gemmatimonadaceae bacterium]
MRFTVVLLLLAVACRPTPREDKVDVVPVEQPSTTPPAAGTPPAAAPVLSTLMPDSVRLSAGTISEVALRGSGFATTPTNTVHVGPIAIPQVPSNGAGTEIRVVVPARYTANAEAPPRPLFPGSYPVSVDNGGHRSNTVMLKVIP